MADLSRAERRVKKLASKDLPYSLDAAKLLDMVPELDRDHGLGRVLREVIQSAQGNFDHMRSELRRNTDYHNEHAEETNFIKDEVIPHEHPGFTPRTLPGLSDWTGGDYQMATAFGGEYLQDYNLADLPITVPTYIDRPCTMTEMWVEVFTGGTQDLRFAVYAGDNEAEMPGSLVKDLGTVDVSVAGTRGVTGFEVNLGVGWYWLTVGPGEDVIGNDPILTSFDSGYHSASGQGNLWPFPLTYLDHGQPGQALSYTMSQFWVDGGPAPEWAGHLADSYFGYNSVAPFIQYLIK